MRARARREREALPDAVRALDATPYDVRIDPALDALARKLGGWPRV
jgi:hypothetical protein